MKNAVKSLLDAKTKMSFISNNDLILRQQYINDLADKLEVEKTRFDLDQIYTSAYLGAKYIKTTYPETKKVRVVGMDSIVREIEALDIQTIGGQTVDPTFKDKVIMIDSFNKYEIDPEVSIVLVGLDQNFSYTNLCLASLYIQTAKCRFICTNMEPWININGKKYPGAGSIAEGLQLTLNNEQGS